MWFQKETETETKELKARIKSLKNEKDGVEEDLAKLKLRKKIEDEDIKHLVKMEKERLALDHEKQKLELQKASDAEIAAVKDDYRDKMEAHLEKQVVQTKEMYGEILKRLPNINVKLKGEV